jgi:hypothetical protein
MKILNIVSISLCMLMIACSAKTESKSVGEEEVTEAKPRIEFNADSAYRNVKAQVDFGPRVPGMESHTKCAQYLVGELNMDNIDASEMVNIMRQTNMPIAVMARALKNYNVTDEEISEFVQEYFGNEISDDYLKKILEYANK